MKLQHAAQKNGDQCSLNSKRLQCNGGYLNLPGIVFNQMVSFIYMLYAIIIIHFLYILISWPDMESQYPKLIFEFF